MSVIRFKPVVAAVFLHVVFAASAFADTITVSGNGDYRAGSGGEFNVVAADAGGQALLGNLSSRGYVTTNGTVVGTADGTLMNPGFGVLVGFQTFCIEYSNLTLPGTYEAKISGGAIYGGVAGGVDPDGGGPLPQTDLISVGTGYLYSQFATGALQGYTYANGGGRAASAVMLQEAIWYLEDEVSLTAAQKNLNTFLTGAFGAITLFGDGTGVGVGGAKANNSFYDVMALNLGGVAPNQKQDQLIMVPGINLTSVPDSGLTMALLGLGMGGLAVFRRKFA